MVEKLVHIWKKALNWKRDQQNRQFSDGIKFYKKSLGNSFKINQTAHLSSAQGRILYQKHSLIALETWNFDIVWKMKFLKHYFCMIFSRNFNILEVIGKKVIPFIQKIKFNSHIFIRFFCSLILNTSNDNRNESYEPNFFIFLISRK